MRKGWIEKKEGVFMCHRKRSKKRVPLCLCEKEKKKIKGKRNEENKGKKRVIAVV